MLQVPYIRENKDLVIARLAKRNIDAKNLINQVITLDEKRRATQTELDNVLAELNTISKEIGDLFKTGKPAEANLLKEKTKNLKEASKTLTELLNETTQTLNQTLYQIPNVPNELVPNGNTDADNLEVFKAGEVPSLFHGALPHWELAKKYQLIDFELGAKITGAGYPVYTGKGAKLQRALIQYFLDKNTDAGYLEVIPPYLINTASGYGTGQLPDKEGQMYEIANNVSEDTLYLIPTAEVPVTNMYRDVIINENDLPIKNTAYSPCFRREAGSYGKDVRGLNRLHQFEKVEIVNIEKPENSYAALDAMVAHVKTILEDLKLPFRILRLCGGDLGFTSALTYDFEVFSTAQNKWLEVSSVSNFESFQANRLKLRIKNNDGKNTLAHTLNGSALALPRILAGILENYQTPEGINVPEVLVPYTGFKMIN